MVILQYFTVSSLTDPIEFHWERKLLGDIWRIRLLLFQAFCPETFQQSFIQKKTNLSNIKLQDIPMRQTLRRQLGVVIK